MARPFFVRVEALRGVCAMLVAGYHMSGWNAPIGHLLPDQPWAGVGPIQNAVGRLVLYLLSGHAALMVFFVISGFVLRVALQYGPQTFGPAALRFHIARIFRIYPIVMVSVLVAAVAHGWRLPDTGEPVTASAFIANLLLLQVTLNGTLWAIQLELLMAPVIVVLYFVERRWGPRPLAVIALAATGLAFAKWTWWAPLSEYVFPFVLGMLVPTLVRERALVGPPALANLWLGLAMLGLFLPYPLLGFFSKWSAVIEGYAAPVLVRAIAYRPGLRGADFLDWAPIRLLGRASGSYYVLHISLLPATYKLVQSLVPARFSLAAPALADPLVLLVCLVLLIPVAMLGYHAVEAPGISLGRRVARVLSGRGAPSAAAEAAPPS